MPKIEINLTNIRKNAANVVEAAADKGISVWGVTKGAAGDWKVAQAMIEGGVTGVADSRLQNLKQLAGLPVPLMMLRIPRLSEAEKVVKRADVSLNSELKVIKALNEAASRQNTVHKIILMVDLGDRREGILPQNLVSVGHQVIQLSNIKLHGIGTNLACFRGITPNQQSVSKLEKLVEDCEKKLSPNLKVVSGGNSSSLPLLLADDFDPASNCYRVGETILLGRTVPTGKPFPLTTQKTFTLIAEVIEVKTKPPGAEKRKSSDFPQKNQQKRAILAVGKQDITPTGLNSINEAVTIIGASSDHLVVDAAGSSVEIGDELKFKLEYSSLLRAMSSSYVKKVYNY